MHQAQLLALLCDDCVNIISRTAHDQGHAWATACSRADVWMACCGTATATGNNIAADISRHQPHSRHQQGTVVNKPQFVVGVSTATGSRRRQQPCPPGPEPTLAAVQQHLATQATKWAGPPPAVHQPAAWRVACLTAEQELLLAAASSCGHHDRLAADPAAAAWPLHQLLQPYAARPLHSELHANPPQPETDRAGKAVH